MICRHCSRPIEPEQRYHRTPRGAHHADCLPRAKFMARDLLVIRIAGQESASVCATTSRTMARRIANALNQYTPNDRGY